MKVDNSYSTSDALRHYGKAATPAAPFPPPDEDAPAPPPKKPAETGPGMDRVTLSPEAMKLLAQGVAPDDAAPPEAEPEMTYSARVHPVSET